MRSRSGGVVRWAAELPAALARRRPGWARLVRYGAVSAVLAPTTLVALWLLHGVAGLAAWQANLLVVSVGAVPAYLLNRSWVWHRTGRHRLWGEVVPFWAMALVGGVASTLAVNAVARWDSTGLVVLVNLGTYGTLWLVKFAFLDSVLWSAERRARGAHAAGLPGS